MKRRDGYMGKRRLESIAAVISEKFSMPVRVVEEGIAPCYLKDGKIENVKKVS